MAPGRVNLIGEHTDYNDGHVLPMAIDRYIGVAVAPREDDTVHAHAVDLGDHDSFQLAGLGSNRHNGWSGYIAGVVWALQQAGVACGGADIAISGNIPIGAGLSSSAALEMAVMRALCALHGRAWAPVAMAQVARQAENEYVGVACGIMDQFASAASKEGCALLLDCRTLEAHSVLLPEEAQIVVMDTGVRRSLADSVYNSRRTQCEDAVDVLREHDPSIRALCDASLELLLRHRDAMSPDLYRRAHHVLSENERPARMAEALEQNDLSAAGELMYASHESLRDDFEVSSPELNAIVELAQEHRGCYGARLTGAGLGGCAVALVARDASEAFISEVGGRYRNRYDHASAFYACNPSAGAQLYE